jgi:poly-gamma-glutamate capsule biosynthesis protein CapA/YwtB (metallophosphatase superfamily)
MLSKRVFVMSVLLAAVASLVAPSLSYAAWNGGHDVVGCTSAAKTWYFAEGTTRPGFNEWICLLNPSRSQTTAHLAYMLSDGTTTGKDYSLPANSRTTVDVANDVAAGSDVSVKVASDAPVVAERPMYFRYNGTITGGHDVVGANAPQETWYFAEGTCRPDFDPYICIQNPGASDADVRITYMLGNGKTAVQALKVTKSSRSTVVVKQALGEGDDAAHDFSAKVETTNGAKVVAERPMYFNYKGSWTGGHDVVGALSPAPAFYFAEGTCRPGFDPYICIQNPGATAAHAKITYMLGNGAVKSQALTVARNSRYTAVVKQFLGEYDNTEHDFSAKVETTDGSMIIAERPMYFAYKGAWTGGHDVVGALTPATRYYFAEGTCRPGFDPYLCIQNAGAADTVVSITYMLGDGSSRAQQVGVGKNSRTTVFVKDTLGEANDAAHDFSAEVEAPAGSSIVVERPMYFNYYSTARWTLCAVGDVNLGGDMSPILSANGFGYVWSGVSDKLKAATLTFANLECTMSYRGEQVQGKTFTFRGDPAALPAMRDAGVDVVSQANNHARDFGATALLDCLGYLNADGIAHCGAGADYGSAHVPAYLNAQGLRVAFLAYDDIGFGGWYAGTNYPGVCDATDTGQMVADIAGAKANADLVVVSFHWGTERKYTPDAAQTALAHLAVDQGADIVLGTHPHVDQGFEFYKGKLIANSLGNFVFSPGSAEGHYSMLTEMSMDARGFTGLRAWPVYINNGRPGIVGGADGTNQISQVAGLSQQLGTPARVGDGVMYIP